MARAARKTGVALAGHIARLAWNHPGAAACAAGWSRRPGRRWPLALATYHAADPSLNAASAAPPTNALGLPGAMTADIGIQSLGLASALVGADRRGPGPEPRRRATPQRDPDPASAARAGRRGRRPGARRGAGLAAPPTAWPLAVGLGGFWGEAMLSGLASLLAWAHLPLARPIAASVFAVLALGGLGYAIGLRKAELRVIGDALAAGPDPQAEAGGRRQAGARRQGRQARPFGRGSPTPPSTPRRRPSRARGRSSRSSRPRRPPKESPREQREAQSTFEFVKPGGFRAPRALHAGQAEAALGAVRRRRAAPERPAAGERAGRVRRPRPGGPDPHRAGGHAL